jgi:hypothetical protein
MLTSSLNRYFVTAVLLSSSLVFAAEGDTAPVDAAAAAAAAVKQENSAKWKEFDFAKLRKEITDRNITKLDDLFPILPVNMKKNPLLVYDSEALAQHFASPMAPRMVLFNRDASLIMTIAQNPGATKIEKGKDALEIVAFNKDTGKFEMYVDSFDGKRKPFEVLDKNPAKCTKCHGSDPRPLFQDYNGWPGIYGSYGTQGVAAFGSPEFKNLKSFLDKYKPEQGPAPEKNLSDRYTSIDLSGFYKYPLKDKTVLGTVYPAGTGGIAYASQDFDGVMGEFATKIKFAPQGIFGMEIESLMHKKLAKKLSRRADFDSTILPLMYYLGDEMGDPGFNPNGFLSRCGHDNEQTEETAVGQTLTGHPNKRINKVYNKLVQLSEGNKEVLEAVIAKLSTQILRDANIREKAVKKHNFLTEVIDPRIVIASVPFSAYFPSVRKAQDETIPPVTNGSPDGESFRKQTALIEVIYQKLGLNESDISTSRETPTTGVYHLSRLGLMPVDEQYFQGFMRGLKWAVPEKLATIDQMSCQQVEDKAMESLAKLFGQTKIKLKDKGLLYK